MTCPELTCIHEPFGDAFYWGPERLGTRWAEDEDARRESGYSQTTYRDVFEDIDVQAAKVRLSRRFLFSSRGLRIIVNL